MFRLGTFFGLSFCFCAIVPLRAEEQSISLSKLLSRFESQHSRFYMGYKNQILTGQNSRLLSVPCVARSGKITTTKAGDLTSNYMRNYHKKVHNPTSKQEAFSAVEKLKYWVQSRLRDAKRLSVLCANLKEHLSSLEGSSAKLASPAAPPVSDLRACLIQLQASDPEAPEYGYLRDEALGIACRAYDLSLWMKLQLKWMKENIICLLEYDKRHPDAPWSKFRLAEYPGGAGLLARIHDLAEIQRQMEDLLRVEKMEPLMWQQPWEGPGIRNLDEELRAYLLALCMGAPVEVRRILEETPTTAYDISCMNYILWNYGKARKIRDLKDVIGKWNARTSGQGTRQGLFEVMFPKQGCVHISPLAEERFDPGILAMQNDVVLDVSKREVCAQVTRLFFEPYKKEWTYDAKWKIRNMRDAFTQKRADCFRSSGICGSVLGNLGFDGIYPIRIENHAGFLVSADNKIVFVDPLLGLSEVVHSLPQGFLRKRTVDVYVRTLCSWINRETYMPEDNTSMVITVPYYEDRPLLLETLKPTKKPGTPY